MGLAGSLHAHRQRRSFQGGVSGRAGGGASAMSTGLLVCAVIFGALTVALLAVLDFHRPFAPSEIRYAALRERYYFALSAYAVAAVVAFILILNAVISVIIPFDLWSFAGSGKIAQVDVGTTLLAAVPVTVF